MGLAELIAVTMALARLRLAPELARLITQERVWPLAILLTSWAAGKPGLLPQGQQAQVAALPPLFALAFDSLQGELIPFLSAAARPSTDPIRVRLAGLSILLAGMIGRIGAQNLQTLVTNRQFVDIAQAINERSPIPEVVLAAFKESAAPSAPAAAAPTQGTPDRIRSFDRFDYPKRAPESDPAFLRRQLDDPSISPEMRMFYEETLAFKGLPVYRSDEEAKIVWQTILKSPMPDEVRSYFASQLAGIGGGSVLV